MKINILLCCLVLMMLVPSCKMQPQLTEPLTGSLSSSRWQLVRIDTAGGSILLNQADTVLLRFNDDQSISGESHGLCRNTYFGIYSISTANSIRVDSLVSTEMACTNSRYWHYHSLLGKVRECQRTSLQLRLYGDQRSQVLVFRPVQ
ncbi:META domain-containing protein [bacterium]|nr:MAG: META domain-containing protein [bacterium]